MKTLILGWCLIASLTTAALSRATDDDFVWTSSLSGNQYFLGKEHRLEKTNNSHIWASGNSNGYVDVISCSDGSVQSVTLPNTTGPHWAGVCVTQGVVIHSSGAALTAVSLSTGKTLWQNASLANAYAPSCFDGNVYVALDHTITALDATTGAVHWHHGGYSNAGHRYWAVGAAQPSEKFLCYASATDGTVCLDRTSGTFLWRQLKAPANLFGSTASIRVDESLGLVFVLANYTSSNTLFALDILTGKAVWYVLGLAQQTAWDNTDEWISTRPSNNTLFIINGTFVAGFNATDGTLLWKTENVFLMEKRTSEGGQKKRQAVQRKSTSAISDDETYLGGVAVTPSGVVWVSQPYYPDLERFNSDDGSDRQQYITGHSAGVTGMLYCGNRVLVQWNNLVAGWMEETN